MTTPNPDRENAVIAIPSPNGVFEPASERALVVVLPHPDDESFAAGGTIARCADTGVPVTYVCGTYGDMGRRMGRPAFANRESLRDVRLLELHEACRILGAELHMLGLRDKCIEFEDPEQVAERVRQVIRERAPSSVITFYPGHGVHPDHDALGHATVLAVRGLPVAERPRLLAVAVGDRAKIREELGEPAVASDIRAVAQRKLDALRAHRSQTEAMFLQLAAEADRPPTEDEDEQARAYREEWTTVERYYELDPDAPTLLE
jgi:N-acetylglucosamine malate deacetylase 2